MNHDNNTKEFVADLLVNFSGQQNTLTINRAMIDLTESLEAALLLGQIIYWSDRTKMKDGWFAKSYQEWTDELTLSEYQVRKSVKVLTPAGVETNLKHFNGVPTLHYRLNKLKFSEWILKKLQDRPRIFSRMDTEENSEPLTEPTSEPTTEIITRKREKVAKVPNSETALFKELKEAIRLSMQWETPTRGEWGQINGAAKQLAEVGCPVEDIPPLHKHCAALFTTFTPMALATHYSTFKANRPKPKPVFEIPEGHYDPALDDGTPATPEQIAAAKAQWEALVKSKSGNSKVRS